MLSCANTAAFHQERSHIMADTVKIPRPKFLRNAQGSSDRVEGDARGNAVSEENGSTETVEVEFDPALDSVDESPRKPQP
jgi:hypothetical protein